MSDPPAQIRLDACGCCEAGLPEVPARENRPGQPALGYRVGTHNSFLQRMLARLARELPALTSRAGDDPAIALLDAWAAAADVLSFYSERIVNEHYLRTATERRSVLELARAIGYELRPGVAAGTVLAFPLDEFPGSPTQTSIPVGTKVQSVPAPAQQPQTFETIETIDARAKWNAMRPRQTRPQRLALNAGTGHLYRFAIPGDPPLRGARLTTIAIAELFPTSTLVLGEEVTSLQAQAVNEIVIAGTNSRLAPGDRLLFVGVRDDNTHRTLVAPVLEVAPDQERGHTRVVLDIPLPDEIAFVDQAIIATLLAALLPSPMPLPLGQAQIHQLLANRTLSESQVQAQITTNQWAPLDVELVLKPPPPPPADIFAFRERLGFFGHNGPLYSTLPAALTGPPATTPPGDDPQAGDGLAIEVPPVPYPLDWDSPGQRSIWMSSRTDPEVYYDGGDDALPDIYLERVVSELVPGSWVVFEHLDARPAYQVRSVVEHSLAGYGITGRATGLMLDDVDGTDLLNDTPDKPEEFGFRTTTAYVVSQPLELAALPIADVVPQGATELMLDGAVLDLQPGRLAVLTGEQAGTPGIFQSELLTLDESLHVVVAEPEGDAGYTVLRFAPGLQHSYVRATVTINANVARATHGETVRQVLGSGDGAQAHQRFALRKPPLTYVSAPTASGARSTLELRVDGVRWDEAPSLFGLNPHDEGYVVRHEDDGTAQIIFGDGERGARLPTGFENVTATYRSGIGLEGNLAAGRLTLLLSRPLGVGGVSNPLPASDGAPPERLEDARTNAPLTVRTFERIVSLQDYEDFARAFVGIGKAQARMLWSGERRIVHLTVAAANGDPVGPQSALFPNLVRAIDAARETAHGVCVGGYVRRQFHVSARVLVHPRHEREVVFAAVEAALRAAFSFERRAFGQAVTAAEVLSVIQGVPGVVAADLDQLYRHLFDLAGRVSILPALQARWSHAQGGPAAGCAAILPGELLLIQSISLTEMEQ